MLFVSRAYPSRILGSNKLWKRTMAHQGKLNNQSTKEEQLQMLEAFNRRDAIADFDLKGQKIQVFDVRFPTPITSTLPGLGSKLEWVRVLLMDRVWSTLGLRRAYKTGLMPAPQPSILSLLTLSSPVLSKTSLSLYTSMNQALSKGDIRALEKVCSEEQFERLKARIKSRPRGQMIDWKMDEKSAKAEVLSVRCLDAWSTQRTEDYCAQALVRFDTRQSIAVYAPGGKLVSGDPNKTVRVREHLLLEKKNWIGAQHPDWTIRTQMPQSD